MNVINKILIVFYFLISPLISLELDPQVRYVDSLYESGQYNESAQIITDLYERDQDNIDIVFRLARSIFLIAEEEENKSRQADRYYKGFE